MTNAGKALGALVAALAVATVALTAPSPPAGEAAADEVTAWDVTGKKPVPCEELSTEIFPAIEGGCLVRLPKQNTRLAVLTPFGTLDLGRCGITLNLQIGPRGDSWLQALVLSDYPGQTQRVCGDLRLCREKGADDYLPWKGKIVRSGEGFRSTHAMCLDTCMGRFEGRLAFDLVKERGGDWRMRSVNSVAGSSGFQFNGDWKLDAVDAGPSSAAYLKREGADAPGFDLR